MWGVGKFYSVLQCGGSLRVPCRIRSFGAGDVEYFGTRDFSASCRQNATGRARNQIFQPPPDRRFSRATLIGIGTASVVTVSCLVSVAAAKANPKFRSWLESRLPFFKPLTKLFIDDRILSFKKHKEKPLPAVQNKSSTRSPDGSGANQKRDDKTHQALSTQEKVKRAVHDKPVKTKSRKEEEEERKRRAAVALAQRQKEEEEEKQRRLEQRRKLEETERLAQEETVRVRKQQAAEEVSAFEKNIAKQAEQRGEVSRVNAVAVHATLLKLLSAATETSNAQKELATTVQAHTGTLYGIVKARASHDDDQVAAALRKAERCKQEITGSKVRAKRSIELFQQARVKFDEAVREARSLGLSSLSDDAGQTASRVLHEVDERIEESTQAIADQAVMEGFCQQMAERHHQYEQGLIQLKKAPTDEENGDKEVLSSAQSSYNSDLQSLLAFAQERVEQMEKALAERQRREAEGTALLLEQQRQEDHRVMQLKLDHLRQQLERQHANELQERAIQAQQDLEDELRKQLKRQASVHNDHLSSALTEQAERLQEKWRHQLKVELGEQADEHLRNMEKLAASFRGSEETAEDVRKTVLAGHNTLVLGQACQSLASAVDTSSARVQPLAPLVNQVQSVLPNDEFVKVVLASVPHEVLENGAESSYTLHKRFARVKKVCGRVALLGEKGGGLGTYLLSYFQSVLLLQKECIGSADDYSVEASRMSAYDLLSAAERQLELGHMDNTVRLLNQLKGQSRVLAEDWIRQAQLLLAAQQAAELLNAYSNLLAAHVNPANK